MSKFFKRWGKNCKIKVIGLSIGGCFEPGMVMLKAISLRVFQNKKNIYPLVLPESLTENLKIFKKICFICNGKYISNNSTYNSGGIRRCKMDCVI